MPDDTRRKQIRLRRHNAPTFVYQCWNDRGTCLYIGTSSSLGGRLTSHTGRSWWKAVHHVTAELYPDRHTALRAEAAAIEEHQPAYNWYHTEKAIGARVGGKVLVRKAEVLGERA